MAGALQSAASQPQTLSDVDPSVGVLSQVADMTGNTGMEAVSDRALAISRAMRRLSDMKYSNVDLPMLGASAGMLAPTRSGSFGESLGNAATGLAGGVKGNLENLGLSEDAQAKALQNQILGLNVAGFRNLQNQTGGNTPLGGAFNPGAGNFNARPGPGTPPGQPQGQPGASGYPVPPLYNMATLAQQAGRLMTFPAGMELAKSLYSMLEKGMDQKVYLGVDGHMYPIPGALTATAKGAYATEIGKTAAANQGNVTIPSEGGFAPGITNLGTALQGLEGQGTGAPITSTAHRAPLAPPGPLPAPAPGGPGVGSGPGGVGTAPGLPAVPSAAPGPVGGVSRPAPGGPPIGGGAPSATTQGLPAGPTVSTVGGRQIMTMPSAAAKTATELGGYGEEATQIGKGMGDWYNGMRQAYEANQGVGQNLDMAEKALEQFRSGASAPFEKETARWLRAFNIDPSRLKLADPAAVQELNKAMTQMVFAAIRKVSSRPAYLEFQMLQNAYPNEALEPEANMAILKTLRSQMKWENNLYETVDGWRRSNPGKSLSDFNFQQWTKANPRPQYEDDALSEMIARGGIRGVQNPAQMYNNPALRGGAPAGGGVQMQPGVVYRSGETRLKLGPDNVPHIVNPNGSLGAAWQAPQ